MQGRSRLDRRFEAVIRDIHNDTDNYPQLLEDGWPLDTTQPRRIVAAILGHLKAADVPKLDSTGRIVSSHSACIRAVLPARRAIHGIFRIARHTLGKAERLEGLLDGLQGELWGLLSWLEFVAQNSAAFVALLPPDSGVPAYYGSISAADILGWLPGALEHVQVDESFLQAYVALVLSIWMMGPGIASGDEGVRTPQEYRSVNFSLFQMFYACLSQLSIRNIFLEQINGFNRRSLGRLVGSFIDHCKKWEEIWKGEEELGPNQQDNLALLVTATQLIAKSVPRFSRALFVSGYPVAALQAALAHPKSLSRTPEGGAPPLAIRVAQEFIHRRSSQTCESLHIMPDLLKASLLRVMLESLLVSPEEGGVDSWDAEDGFHFLSDLCYFPHITAALTHAMHTIPEALYEAVDSHPTAEKKWELFLRNWTSFYQSYQRDESQTGRVTLCDYLDHSTTSSLPSVEVDAQQCSWYHTTVYCSEACQRGDPSWRTCVWGPTKSGNTAEASRYSGFG